MKLFVVLASAAICASAPIDDALDQDIAQWTMKPDAYKHFVPMLDMYTRYNSTFGSQGIIALRGFLLKDINR